jgi:acyl-ACP thioesterase
MNVIINIMLSNYKSAKFKQKIYVGTAEVGLTRHLSIPWLFLAFQEGGFQHSKILGAGMIKLLDDNAAWVLARELAVIKRLPGLDETCLLETWPSGRESNCFFRDFRLLSSQKQVLISARTAWFIVDLKKRIPLNPDLFFTRSSIKILAPSIDRAISRLDSIKKKPEHSIKVIVNSMDIDFNGHVNNSKYVHWILGCLPLEFLKNHTLKEIQVNFINEALYNDCLTVSSSFSNIKSDPGQKHSQDKKTFTVIIKHSVKKEDTSKDLVRAVTKWAKL